MYDIDELIEYHQESEFLDFKQEEYNDKANLIKDVLALANASVAGNRYIIIGVKKKDGKTQLFNIQSTTDSANIQQTIHKNIAPELDIEYSPYTYKGHNLMVLTIKEPIDQPYMTSKEVTYPSGKVFLKSHECWIRKGSYQVPAAKKDFDRMYAAKSEKDTFSGNVSITFSDNGTDIIKIDSLEDLKFPSEKQEKEIKRVIKYKEELQEKNPMSYNISNVQPMIPWQGTTYAQRDLETLRKNLKNVKSTYYDDDLYYLFEKKAFKLDLDILNSGSSYLEDGSVEIRIPKLDKLLVADKIHFVHRPNSNPLLPYVPRTSTYDEMHYPTVDKKKDCFVVTEDIGNLKHNIKQKLLRVPIRLAIGDVGSGTEIILNCKIFGKNLKNAIEKEIKIVIN